MSGSGRLQLGRPWAVRTEHNCFGCGSLNPIGLHLAFYEEPEHGGVQATWVPEANHEGFNGIVHGGLISTVLDEVMGWAVTTRNLWAVTGTLSVAFRKPLQIGEETRGIGWIVSERGRKVEVRAELRRTSDGVLVAEGDAIFVKVPEETARAWQARYTGQPPA